MNRRGTVRRAAVAAALALVVGVAGLTSQGVQDADAASCVRIVGGVFNAPGNDNYMPYLNQEYILLKNYCASYRTMTGWTVNDYGRKHTYLFPSGYRIYPGYTVKLHSGLGTNGKYHLYWNRSYGAVWNNTPPERAYLRNPSGYLMSSWSPY